MSTSRVTWVASSRVGTTTRACVFAPGRDRWWARHPRSAAEMGATLERVADYSTHRLLGAGDSAGIVPPVSEWTEPMTDADRQQAVVDLLGVLAYGELIAFERLAD